MTHVLVLTAIDLEARGLARHLGLPAVGDTDRPHYRAGALEVACVGLRAARLTERLTAPRPTLVVSAGACGGLAPHLRRGDLIVPETVVAPSGDRHVTDAWPALPRAGVLLTVAEVVETAAAKARLWVETGALGVDMESAMIVQWARAHRLPVVVVRAVADTATEAVPADLVGLVEPGGRLRPGRAVRAALARPRALADAIALGRGTEAALKAVAATLGRIARSHA